MASLARRFWTRNAALMLGRNTVASSAAFLVGLGALWVMVEQWGWAERIAAAASFVVANSLHYLLAYAWVFRGSARALGSGYAFFLVNGIIGLGAMMAAFDALLRFTPVHYMAARVLASVVAGLVIFALNATLNFRRL